MHFSQLLKVHVLTVAILGILFNEKVPSSKKINILEYFIRQSEVKVRILQHDFEQFSCIQKQKIYDEIFGWFV